MLVAVAQDRHDHSTWAWFPVALYVGEAMTRPNFYQGLHPQMDPGDLVSIRKDRYMTKLEHKLEDSVSLNDFEKLERTTLALHKELEESNAEMRDVKQHRDELVGALQESVALQSFYAGLLNMHDGGARLKFKSGTAWIERLKQLKEKP